ncbi:protein kinase domain-containing protein [Phthorimaea operculella]|nr:protein kinase domain-containing protein [Phthorimaea operculella]
MAGGPYDAKIAGLYDLLDTLGSGHFAVVKMARHVFTGEKVAVKVIDKSKLDSVSKSHLFQEVRCMKLVQHPNVVRLYEVIDTQTKLYLILELGDGGDLYDYIMRHESGLSESLARDYFRQIVRAISYCHRLHVVHRDLKPENVVFFEKLGVVKLTDFGFSNKFCPGQKLETSCGSLAYSAPEILLGDSYDAPAVDVWSLGVILYMLVCGQPPFQEANDSETLTMIMDCKYNVPPHISSSCKRLIARMLVREPEKRAMLSEIATDPWVTAGEGIAVEDFDTPLVAKEQLPEEDRSAIIQRMVNGNIATKEQIVEALEKNEYNHVTATYYLLAERKLRAKRQEERALARRPEALSVSRSGGASGRNLLAPPPHPAAPRTPQDVPPRSRKCSIVREEEDDEEGAVASTGSSRVADARRGSRSEGRLHMAARAAAPRPTDPPPAPPAPPPRAHQLADNFTKVNLEDEEPPTTTLRPVTASFHTSSDTNRQRLDCPRRRARAQSCSSSDLSGTASCDSPVTAHTRAATPTDSASTARGDERARRAAPRQTCQPSDSSHASSDTNRQRLDCPRRRARAQSCSSSDLSGTASCDSPVTAHTRAATPTDSASTARGDERARRAAPHQTCQVQHHVTAQ